MFKKFLYAWGVAFLIAPVMSVGLVTAAEECDPKLDVLCMDSDLRKVRIIPKSAIRDVALAPPEEGDVVIATVGAVTLTIDGPASFVSDKVTVASAGLGDEEPQCTIWSGVPFVTACEDNDILDDRQFMNVRTGDPIEYCLRWADVAIDVDEDGDDEYYLEDKLAIVTHGACPT